jgi:MoaA/NifB/PqqE/SkfB family radical SAM enzyme
MDVGLTIEVAGCPTTCMHCWARGTPYEAMPIAEIAWVLGEARRFCAGASIGFGAFPMHEILAHPQASELLRLFADSEGQRFLEQIEPIATVGVPLGMREDWQEVLTTLRSLGTTTAWFAFHGVGEAHDRQVNRAGAFQESCLAVERARSKGFRCGCNVFVTRENLQQFDALAEALRALKLDEMSWEPASFCPTARSRRYERERPDLNDLMPHVERIRELSRMWKSKWANLEAHTEAAYVREAAAHQDAMRSSGANDEIGLVCRRNFDVYIGKAGLYGTRLGNLKAEGILKVFEKAIEHGPCPDEALYFATDCYPPFIELARRYGDPSGLKVHFSAESLRYRWLDTALAGYRRY